MDSKYQSWFRFGTDHNKQERPTLRTFLAYVEQPYEESAKKPELLYLTERYCTKLSGIPTDYLQRGFDPTSLTCAKLRQILAFNGIRYGRDITKETLIDIFKDSVNIFRSNNGIDETAPQSERITEMFRGFQVKDEESTRNPLPQQPGPARIPPFQAPGYAPASAEGHFRPQQFQQMNAPVERPVQVQTPQGLRQWAPQAYPSSKPADQFTNRNARQPQQSASAEQDINMPHRDALPALTRSQRIVVRLLEDLLTKAVNHVKNDDMDAVANQLRQAADQVEDDD